MQNPFYDMVFFPANIANEVIKKMSQDFLSHDETEALIKGVTTAEDDYIKCDLTIDAAAQMLIERRDRLNRQIEVARARVDEICDMLNLLKRIKPSE